MLQTTETIELPCLLSLIFCTLYGDGEHKHKQLVHGLFCCSWNKRRKGERSNNEMLLFVVAVLLKDCAPHGPRECQNLNLSSRMLGWPHTQGKQWWPCSDHHPPPPPPPPHHLVAVLVSFACPANLLHLSCHCCSHLLAPPPLHGCCNRTSPAGMCTTLAVCLQPLLAFEALPTITQKRCNLAQLTLCEVPIVIPPVGIDVDWCTTLAEGTVPCANSCCHYYLL